jgi:LPXTG-site transpeptidase (sortase) family protein
MLIAWNVVLAALCAGLALAMGLLALQNRSQYPFAAGLLLLAAASLVMLGAVSVFAVPPSAATAELAAPELESLEAASLELAALPAVPTLAPTLTLAEPAGETQQFAILSSVRAGAFLDPVAEPVETPPPRPARLRIARLNVDAPIMTIPIVNGRWDLSALGADVGWLTTTGAFPGDKLAMALVGHITTERLTRGAFADLERIKPGDEIVYAVAEVEYVYQVRRRSRVTPDNVKALYVPDGQTLLLLTCTDWDAEGKRYANRLLVEAGLVAQRAAGEGDH